MQYHITTSCLMVALLVLGVETGAVAMPTLVDAEQFHSAITSPVVETFEDFDPDSGNILASPVPLENSIYWCDYPAITTSVTGKLLWNQDADPPTGRVFTGFTPGTTLFGLDLIGGSAVADGLLVTVEGASGTLVVQKQKNDFNGFVGVHDAHGIFSVTIYNSPELGDQTGYGFDNVTTGSGLVKRQSGYIDVIKLLDINGNGSPELAFLQIPGDGEAEVIVKDSATNVTLSKILFDAANKVAVGFTDVLDANGNGSSEIAVLFVRTDNQKVRVHIKDSLTGQWIGQVNVLSPEWEPAGITSQDFNQDGVSELSVLGVKNYGTAVAVQVVDTAGAGELRWLPLVHTDRFVYEGWWSSESVPHIGGPFGGVWSFTLDESRLTGGGQLIDSALSTFLWNGENYGGFTPLNVGAAVEDGRFERLWIGGLTRTVVGISHQTLDFMVDYDADGNLLFQLSGPDTIEEATKYAKPQVDGIQSGIVNRGAYTRRAHDAAAYVYKDLISLPDLDGNGSPELAALRVLRSGLPHVFILDSDTGRRVNDFWFEGSDKTVIGATALRDISGNGYPEVAILMATSDGRGRVHIKDAQSTQWIGKINFFNQDWDVLAIASQDLDRDGVSEVSVLGLKDDGSNTAIQAIDSLDLEQINWIPLPVD